MVGQTISHYLIREKLGGGGMGVVYKAEDLKTWPLTLTSDAHQAHRRKQIAAPSAERDFDFPLIQETDIGLARCSKLLHLDARQAANHNVGS